MKYRTFYLNIVAQSLCGAATLRDIQNPNGHNPEPPAIADIALSKRFRPSDLLRLILTSKLL